MPRRTSSTPRAPVQPPSEVTVHLGEGTCKALEALNGDLQAVREMINDLSATATEILEAIQWTIAAEVKTDRERVEAAQTHAASAEKPSAAFLVEPGTGIEYVREGGKRPDPNDPNRVRQSPFGRSPRSVQVAWLQEVMSDGGWYAPTAIAREYAGDERHFRYLRGALSGRLREMHEDGMVERRDSHIRGSMYEFRLVNP